MVSPTPSAATEGLVQHSEVRTRGLTPRVTRSLPGKWGLPSPGCGGGGGSFCCCGLSPWDPQPLGPAAPGTRSPGSPAFWEQARVLWASFGPTGPEDGDPEQEGMAGEVWVGVLGRCGLARGFPCKGLPLTLE